MGSQWVTGEMGELLNFVSCPPTPPANGVQLRRYLWSPLHTAPPEHRQKTAFSLMPSAHFSTAPPWSMWTLASKTHSVTSATRPSRKSPAVPSQTVGDPGDAVHDADHPPNGSSYRRDRIKVTQWFQKDLNSRPRNSQRFLLDTGLSYIVKSIAVTGIHWAFFYTSFPSRHLIHGSVPCRPAPKPRGWTAAALCGSGIGDRKDPTPALRPTLVLPIHQRK